MITSSNIQLSAQVRVKPELPELSKGHLTVGIPLFDIPIPAGANQVATAEFECMPGVNVVFSARQFALNPGDANQVLFPDVEGAPVVLEELKLLCITATALVHISSEAWSETRPVHFEELLTRHLLLEADLPLAEVDAEFFTFRNPGSEPLTVRIVAMGPKVAD